MSETSENLNAPAENCGSSSQQRMVGLRGLSVSGELIKPREQQIADSLVPPSVVLLAWLETDSRSDDKAQPNAPHE